MRGNDVSPAGAGADAGPVPRQSDQRLVHACLRGDQEAWSQLIDKYKRLIYSIPLKYHAPPEDTADIFQAVCIELLTELPRLRRAESLPKWLVTVTNRACLRWKQRRETGPVVNTPVAADQVPAAEPRDVANEAEREQRLRQALSELPPRCQQMIRLLFFEQPPVPYSEVARRLGVATGSIGFIRGRCLARLRRILELTGNTN